VLAQSHCPTARLPDCPTRFAALTLAGTLLLAVAVFWPCLRYGFAMDDFALIEAGRAPLAVGIPAHFAPQPGVHYRPLGQYGYFWLTDRLLPYAPLPFHLANLALHLLTVLLVWWLARRFVADVLAVALATLFFAIHSGYFLVISWVALAGEITPALCCLAALACWLTYCEPGARRRPLWWALTCLCVVLALLAKQVAVALPPALLLYQVLFQPAAGWPRRGPLRVAPAALLLQAPLALYAWFVLRVSGSQASGPYHLVFGLDAIRTGLTYLLWVGDLPRLADDYPSLVLAGAALGVVALLAYACWQRERVILFGLGWFALFLAPVVFLPEHMFHYYLYLPGTGVVLVLARLAELVLRGLRRNTRQVLALTCAALLVLCNVVGVVYELGHNPTMVQEAQGQRALATLRADHPRLLPGTTIKFVAPADHIYYVLGYGAAVRLAYPGVPLRVVFADILTPAAAGDGPAYRYRWNGETIVAQP
jgi:hypothetical protein